MGGLGGHIKHLYEDPNLTFNDVLGIVRDLFGSNIRKYRLSIKVDGINIFFTKINDVVAVARNKKQLKKPLIGEDAIREQFAHAPHVAEAFIWAIEQISDLIDDVFDNGRYWVNAELIYKQAQNFISYADNLLVLHILVEVDDNGNIVSSKRITDVNKYVRKIGARAKKIFKTSYLKDVNFAQARTVVNDIRKYLYTISEGNLDYTIKEWLLANLSRQFGDEFDGDELSDLVDRFYKYSSLRNAQKLVRYRTRDLAPIELYIRALLNKLLMIEQMILNAIAKQLQELTLAIAHVSPKTSKDILKMLKKARKLLKNNELSDLQLARMEQAIELLTMELTSNLSDIQPWSYSEGLVIEDDKGNVWKLTGVFQYLNRVNFMLKQI